MAKPAPYRNDTAMPDPEVMVRLAQGLLASGEAVAIFTPEDDLWFASKGFITLYDVQTEPQTFDSIIRHCHAYLTGPLIETDDIDAWLKAANTKRRRVPYRKFEVDMVDGRWMLASESLSDDGWLMVTIRDFTALKRKEFSLQTARDEAIAASETDDLTWLFNRGAIMRRFAELVERAGAGGGGFSAVLIDLDHFKAVNDLYGHDSGDQVLIHFSACMRETLRDRDVLGRVGGEEFLFLMPGATQPQACVVIERLQAALRDQRLMLRTVTLRYTFSAGIAEWKPGKTLEDIYREADQALYAAKASGRDRVSYG